MTVIAAYRYHDGNRVGAVSIDDAAPAAADHSDFVWIGLFEPSEDELRKLATAFRLHPLALEDALKGNQLPKLDIYGDQLFISARTAHLERDAIVYGETAIFVGENHIITVRHGSARSHSAMRAQLEAAPSLLAQGVDYVLHAILDFIVDGYLPVVKTIEENVLEIEECALDSFLERDEVMRIFALRRELIRFQRVLLPMSELCGRLTHLDLPCLDSEARPYFRTSSTMCGVSKRWWGRCAKS